MAGHCTQSVARSTPGPGDVWDRGRTHSGTERAGNTWAAGLAEGRIKKETLKMKAELQ